MNTRNDPFDLFAITAPGLEPVCASELEALGAAPDVTAGGVSWQGDWRSLVRANLELRTASRIVARIGSFRARSFHELERRAPKLAWSRFIAGGAVALRVTARKSKLYHEGAVAERITRILESEHSVRVDAAHGDEESDVADAQLIIVRVFRDVVTISADASGALLHQRGYRLALAKAPLRETIAAALLHVSGWRADSPLADPLCGAGTIPIEAALRARRIPPGLANLDHAPRSYAFEQWPHFDRSLFDDVVQRARAVILPSGGRSIGGSDRNAGAIRAAVANAERAGVGDDVVFETRPLSSFAPLAGVGAIVTNPPYGVRVGERGALASLYAELGRVARERAPGWTLALLSAAERLDAAVGIPLEEKLRTKNGGIAVRMLVGRA
jgi:putative N6-adenine-specific DNA methylase